MPSPAASSAEHVYWDANPFIYALDPQSPHWDALQRQLLRHDLRVDLHGFDDNIALAAQDFVRQAAEDRIVRRLGGSNLDPRDAIHLATALASNADALLTYDQRFQAAIERLTPLRVISP